MLSPSYIHIMLRRSWACAWRRSRRRRVGTATGAAAAAASSKCPSRPLFLSPTTHQLLTNHPPTTPTRRGKKNYREPGLQHLYQEADSESEGGSRAPGNEEEEEEEDEVGCGFI